MESCFGAKAWSPKNPRAKFLKKSEKSFPLSDLSCMLFSCLNALVMDALRKGER